MAEIKRCVQYFLRPKKASDRIWRTAVVVHWIIGAWTITRLDELSLVGIALFTVFALFLGLVAGSAVAFAAHLFWSWKFRPRSRLRDEKWRASTPDGWAGVRLSLVRDRRIKKLAETREIEFAEISSRSFPRQLFYLAPGFPLGWLFLLALDFLVGNNRYS